MQNPADKTEADVSPMGSPKDASLVGCAAQPQSLRAGAFPFLT